MTKRDYDEEYKDGARQYAIGYHGAGCLSLKLAQLLEYNARVPASQDECYRRQERRR
jgi:hypothetical protein